MISKAAVIRGGRLAIWASSTDTKATKPRPSTPVSRSLQISRELKDRASETEMLSNLGGFYSQLGLDDEAIATCEQDLVISRELEDHYGEGQTHNNLGILYKNKGLYDKAIGAYTQSLAVRRGIKDYIGIGQTLVNLAVLWEDGGDVIRRCRSRS